MGVGREEELLEPLVYKTHGEEFEAETFFNRLQA